VGEPLHASWSFKCWRKISGWGAHRAILTGTQGHRCVGDLLRVTMQLEGNWERCRGLGSTGGHGHCLPTDNKVGKLCHQTGARKLA
jgi:hypothetical protein